jgi:hypothetical protein
MTPATQICGRCGIDKPMDEFGFRYPKLGIRHSWCKTCFAEYKRLWYVRNRERHLARVKSATAVTLSENQQRVWEYLALHPCVDCGETDPVVLQFDHLRDKRMDVADMSRSFSWPAILAEIAKCEVRCANCHTRRTARDRGIYLRKHMVLHTTHFPEQDVLHNCQTRAVSSMDRASTF